MGRLTRRAFLWQSGAAVGGLVAVPLIPELSGRAAAADIIPAARLNAAHWGAFTAEITGDRCTRTMPFPHDPNPNRMVAAMPQVLYAPNRIKYPMIRRGFYTNRSSSDTMGRGTEPFVRVSWDEALDIVAGEIKRVKTQYGNRAIYGGSYGWQSAGKFHGAVQGLQRMLGLYGGYVSYVNTYSAPVLPVITPHVLGDPRPLASAWPTIIQNATLVVLFGYDPLVNAEVLSGGDGGHYDAGYLAQLRAKGTPVVSVNPIESDTDQYLRTERIAIRPNTDTALIVALAHVLYTEHLHDTAFLAKYTVGFDAFTDYLTGKADGQPKTPEWAAAITDIPAATIRTLARRMASSHTQLIGGFSLQRASHGEQPVWAMITLSAMLGKFGLPGGGANINFPGGLGVPVGSAPGMPGFAAGANPVKDFVPVNMWVDLLLNPGQTIDYDGQRITYPEIKLVYWAGGNPFHHAQNTNRVLDAWRRPEVTIVQDYVWTASAKHADIVLPATTTLERNDLLATDKFIIAMQQVVPPVFEARSDFDIFAALSTRLGIGPQFTEGKDEMAWLRQFYAAAQQQGKTRGLDLPEFDAFWQQGFLQFPIPESANQAVAYAGFRADPDNAPLSTPSGKIEIYSAKIASFKYDDVPPHPAWVPPAEWLGSPIASRFPLHLLSPHPKERLHSQLNETPLRADYEIGQREPIWLNPADASARGIANGDIVRVFNDRGQTLAGAVVTARTRRGVAVLREGSWYDPLNPGQAGSLDRHGNVNMVTMDTPSSRLADGNPSHTALVEVEKYVGTPPPVTAFTPPPGA